MGPLNPFRTKIGDIAAMVDVGVGKHERLNRGGVKIEIAVFFEGLLPSALEQSAFEHNGMPIDAKKGHRSGHRLRRPMKLKFHDLVSPVG